MGKKSKDSKSKKGEEKVKIDKRFKAALNTYKSKVYCHLTDGVKGKSVSLSKEAIKKLLKKLPDIVEKMNAMDKDHGSDDDSSSSDSD